MKELLKLWEEIHPELPNSAEALQQRVFRVRKLGVSGKCQPGGDQSQASQQGSLRYPGLSRKPLPSVVEEAELVMNSQTGSGQELGGEGDTKPSQNQWNLDGLHEFVKVVKDVQSCAEGDLSRRGKPKCRGVKVG